MKGKEPQISREQIEQLIFVIRGQKVMLDRDLAELYGVATKALKQAVSRNIERFPSDFMFVLTYQELANLRSQIVTSSSRSWGGTRYKPMVFTEQGVAMLSSVLRSKRAVHVNIEIMRTFVRLREMLVVHKELARKLADLEDRIEKHDEDIKLVFEAIRELMTPPDKPSKKIGFKVSKDRVSYRKEKEAIIKKRLSYYSKIRNPQSAIFFATGAISLHICTRQ